jgi:hypothetical protein
MKCLSRVVAAGAIVAIGLCNFGRAQVLDQVPASAVAVLEVRDLQAASDKVAKFAKTLGIDQFDPRFADPLGTVQDEFELKQGLNKSGDMAIAFFAPDTKNKEGADEGKPNAPQVVVLIPTGDYKAFLGNFEDVKDGGNGISEVTVPKNKEHLFVAEHGKYAAAAMKKALLSVPVGLKLDGPAAKEAATKDAIIYVDLKALRPLMEKGMKEVRETIAKQMKDPKAAQANPFATPQMARLMDAYLNFGEKLIHDARSATESLNLTDTGVAFTALADFEPDSDLGKLVAQVQNTDEPLTSGLPAATYFAFGGAKLTPEVTMKMFTDFLEPMFKDPKADAKGEDLTKAFDAMKEALAAMKTMAFGYAATAGAPGEGLMTVVAVAHGDAHKIIEAQKAALPAMSSMMGSMGTKTTVDATFGAPKSVDGVETLPYAIKFNFDPNDAQAAQAQQAMSIIYGRGGLTGVFAAVNDQTFLNLQGNNDKLLADAIASAKANTDTLDQAGPVKKVSGELPKQRAMEFYVALDNIAATAVKVLKQQGVAVPFKLPPNLPPIGVSAGTDGTTARIDALIPTQLIQSITAAGMQAFMQMNGGPGAGQGNGI